MKEPHDEGVADDIGPAPWVEIRDGIGDAPERGNVEGSGGGKRNASQHRTVRVQSREAVSQAQARLREAVARNPKGKLTTLLHPVAVESLRSAFLKLRKRAAVGADHVPRKARWGDYAADLEQNFTDLQACVHRGAYRALPSRRAYIPLSQQGKWLGSVMRGCFADHAVPNNFPAIDAFRYHVAVAWVRTLRRRSQKTSLAWARMQVHLNRYLPKARLLHPWPEARFRARHSGWEPGA